MFKNPWKFHKKSKTNTTQLENSLTHHKLIINLAELESGNSAKVLNLQGSRVLIGKLEAMGILPGIIIFKKSVIPAKGPIIVEKGSIQLALGYNMAKNILIEPITQKV